MARSRSARRKEAACDPMMTAPTYPATANDLWEAAKTLRKKPALVWLLFYKRTCDLWEEDRRPRHSRADGAVAPSPSRVAS